MLPAISLRQKRESTNTEHVFLNIPLTLQWHHLIPLIHSSSVSQRDILQVTRTEMSNKRLPAPRLETCLAHARPHCCNVHGLCIGWHCKRVAAALNKVGYMKRGSECWCAICMHAVSAGVVLPFPWHYQKVTAMDAENIPTWSGRRPGGTQVYSSKAHPESSSDCECLWGSADCPYCTPFPRSLSVGSNRPRATPVALPPPPDVGGRDGGGPAPWPRGLPVPAIPPLCSSRGHLQFRQTFLRQNRNSLLSYKTGRSIGCEGQMGIKGKFRCRNKATTCSTKLLKSRSIVKTSIRIVSAVDDAYNRSKSDLSATARKFFCRVISIAKM
jgi:hypothetical protein